ncbi:VARS [Bugula neritina]|uniref:valine--tRNA ligase n=1 Tax=Bugula neritina TaxID=10212 RepID=A0A7J7JN82_BUGNE|nr:VARS [Bugula neritina]
MLGKLKILPDYHTVTWYKWLRNSKDWCISRQLWWGHRIPAYFVQIQGQPKAEFRDNNYWVTGRSYEEALSKAAIKFNVHPDVISLSQDEDLLDTRFSSGIFPFSTMGWPDNTPNLQAYYPGTLLETGHPLLLGDPLGHAGTIPTRKAYLQRGTSDHRKCLLLLLMSIIGEEISCITNECEMCCFDSHGTEYQMQLCLN